MARHGQAAKCFTFAGKDSELGAEEARPSVEVTDGGTPFISAVKVQQANTEYLLATG